VSGEQGTQDRVLQRSRKAVNRNSVIVWTLMAASGPWLPGVADEIGTVVVWIGALVVLGLLAYLLAGVFA